MYHTFCFLRFSNSDLTKPEIQVLYMCERRAKVNWRKVRNWRPVLVMLLGMNRVMRNSYVLKHSTGKVSTKPSCQLVMEAQPFTYPRVSERRGGTGEMWAMGMIITINREFSNTVCHGRPNIRFYSARGLRFHVFSWLFFHKQTPIFRFHFFPIGISTPLTGNGLEIQSLTSEFLNQRHRVVVRIPSFFVLLKLITITYKWNG
jgi:hypothetical protein